MVAKNRDVTDHELVPEHTVVDEDELRTVLDEYDIDRTDLPKIRHDPESGRKKDKDMALHHLDERVEPGDVVKIVRDSRTTDEAVVYRLVVDPNK